MGTTKSILNFDKSTNGLVGNIFYLVKFSEEKAATAAQIWLSNTDNTTSNIDYFGSFGWNCFISSKNWKAMLSVSVSLSVCLPFLAQSNERNLF